MSEESAYQKWRSAKSPWYIIRWIFPFMLLVASLPYILSQFSILSFNVNEVGEVGDVIGGTTAPFIGFVGIIVTFYAFWVQYQSNFNQRNDIQLERFENQFYEMLRLHSSNVQEMDIDGKFRGRKTFVRMFDEFKYIYLTFYQQSTNSNIQKSYSKEELCSLSFKLFFNGIGSAYDNKVHSLFQEGDRPLVLLVVEALRRIQNLWDISNKPTAEEIFSLNLNNENISDLDMQMLLKKEKHLNISIDNEDGKTVMSFEVFYYPFDGNVNRLGHYYRHLFQTVSFIVNSRTVDYHDDKYRYLKLLRAQLSNHEQLLLYYNALTKMGEEWITEKYFTTYRMIKNIPLIDADFGITPPEKLGTHNEMDQSIFEWTS